MKRIPRIALFIAGIAVTIGKLQIALSRYFDPDEFSHLQWAYTIFQGKLPYKDFFYGYTPLFQWILAPWFFLPEGSYFMPLFRVIMFLFTGIITILLYDITKKIVHNKTLALFAPLTYLLFPIILDKTIEIRPDTPMLLFFLLAVWLLQNKKPRVLLSGLSFGISLLFLPKIFYAIIPLLYLTWSYRKKITDIWMFCCGTALAGMAFLLYFLITGTLSNAYEAIVTGSMTLFFGLHYSVFEVLKPWPLVYLAGGGGLPWVVSTGIWIIGLLGAGTFALKNKRMGLFLLLFIGSGSLYLIVNPFTMTQYLMPIAAIASIGVPLFFSMLSELFPQHKQDVLNIVYILIPLLLLLSFSMQYRERINKTSWNEQRQVLDVVHTVIPKNEPVYDMIGSFMYRQTSFPYMSVAYAIFIDTFNPFHTTLTQSLINTQTKYIILDQKGYVFWKPKQEDLTFILNNYVLSPWFKVYVPGVSFSCTTGVCTQYNVKNEPITQTTTINLPIHGSYELITAPTNQTVTINGVPMKHGDIQQLSTTMYEFTVSPLLRSFTLRWHNL